MRFVRKLLGGPQPAERESRDRQKTERLVAVYKQYQKSGSEVARLPVADRGQIITLWLLESRALISALPENSRAGKNFLRFLLDERFNFQTLYAQYSADPNASLRGEFNQIRLQLYLAAHARGREDYLLASPQPRHQPRR